MAEIPPIPTNLEVGDEKKSLPSSTHSQSDDYANKEATVPRDPEITDQQHQYVTGLKLTVVLVAVTLVSFLMLLDIVILVTAIPKITDQFHSTQDIGWYGAAYTLANAALQPLTGKFYQYFSSKWVYISCLAMFEFGSLLCGVSQSSKMLIVSRAVAGLGSAGLQNGAFTIVAGAVPREKTPAIIGMIMGVSQLGLVLGPVIGGAFTQYATWRWCFFLNLPLGGLAALGLIFCHIPDQIPKGKFSTVIRTAWTKLDLIGFALFAPAAIMFLLALQYGGTKYAWDSATVIGLLCGAAVIFILFVIWEYRTGEDAMIPSTMVSKRIVWCSCLLMFFFMAVTYVTSYYLPIYFQSVKGKTPTMSGVDLFPSILIQLIFAVAAGGLVTKLGYYLPWSIFSSVLIAIASGLFSTFSTTTSTAKWAGYQIILGAGQGSGIQMPIIAAQNAVSPTEIAMAMSLIMFSQTFGGAVFLAASNTILDNSLTSQLAKHAPTVDPKTVISAGATGIRDLVTPSQLVGVLEAYANSIDRVFYLAAGASVACFVVSFGIGWKDVRQKQAVSTVSMA